jgi:hypothetical protein
MGIADLTLPISVGRVAIGVVRNAYEAARAGLASINEIGKNEIDGIFDFVERGAP